MVLNVSLSFEIYPVTVYLTGGRENDCNVRFVVPLIVHRIWSSLETVLRKMVRFGWKE